MHEATEYKRSHTLPDCESWMGCPSVSARRPLTRLSPVGTASTGHPMRICLREAEYRNVDQFDAQAARREILGVERGEIFCRLLWDGGSWMLVCMDEVSGLGRWIRGLARDGMSGVWAYIWAVLGERWDGDERDRRAEVL